MTDAAYVSSDDQATSSLLDKGCEAARAAGYQLQSSWNGFAQLIDYPIGKEILPSMHLIDAPKEATFGTGDWYAQQFGNAVGTALVFYGLGRLLGKGADAFKSTELLAKSEVVGRAAIAGAAYDGILRPVTAGENNFWQTRFFHAAEGAATFATLAGGSLAFRSVGLSASKAVAADATGAVGNKLVGLLKYQAVAGLPAGALAGIVSAETSALTNGRGLVWDSTVAQAAYSYTVGGALLGAVHTFARAKAVAESADRPKERRWEPGMYRDDRPSNPYSLVPRWKRPAPTAIETDADSGSTNNDDSAGQRSFRSRPTNFRIGPTSLPRSAKQCPIGNGAQNADIAASPVSPDAPLTARQSGDSALETAPISMAKYRATAENPAVANQPQWRARSAMLGSVAYCEAIADRITTPGSDSSFHEAIVAKRAAGLKPLDVDACAAILDHAIDESDGVSQIKSNPQLVRSIVQLVTDSSSPNAGSAYRSLRTLYSALSKDATTAGVTNNEPSRQALTVLAQQYVADMQAAGLSDTDIQDPLAVKANLATADSNLSSRPQPDQILRRLPPSGLPLKKIRLTGSS